jgi:flagellin
LAESNSRIVDTDYAQATAELARSMILNQAGSAMLSQANQQPYYVLALLS